MKKLIAINDYGGGELPFPGFGYGNASNSGGITGDAWYGGFSAVGMSLSLTPVDGMKINIGIPMNGQKKVMDTYLSTTLSFTYSLDVGTIKLGADLKPLDANDEFVILAVAGRSHTNPKDDIAPLAKHRLS